jgi:hypothetical protein
MVMSRTTKRQHVVLSLIPLVVFVVIDEYLHYLHVAAVVDYYFVVLYSTYPVVEAERMYQYVRHVAVDVKMVPVQSSMDYPSSHHHTWDHVVVVRHVMVVNMSFVVPMMIPYQPTHPHQ